MAPKKSDIQAPEGFDVNLGRAEASGWVARVPGNVVTARVLGRFEYTQRGKPAAYYQLQLLAECLVYKNKEDGAEDDEEAELSPPEKMPEGTIVNMGESFGLKDLKGAIEMMSRGGVVDVWTGYVRKDPNRSSQGEHWVHYGPKLRVVKQPRKAADDLPF